MAVLIFFYNILARKRLESVTSYTFIEISSNNFLKVNFNVKIIYGTFSNFGDGPCLLIYS